MAKRRTKPPLPDWHLWTEVTRTVSPLRPRAEPVIEDEPLPIPPAAPSETVVRISGDFRIGAKSAPSIAPRHIPKARKVSDKPIEPKMRRKVMRGRVDIDGTIDLHGMRQEEARIALHRYILSRSSRGDRTILVITGKGLKKVDGNAATIIERGVLRSMLPLWLNSAELAPLIAGWDVSAQQHGGEGAYYVRLKRVNP